MTIDDNVRIENRLTKLESAAVALQSQIANMEHAITSRLDYQNGKMGDHFKADAFWMTTHDLNHARSEGFKAGQIAVAGLIGSIVAVALSPVVYILIQTFIA